MARFNPWKWVLAAGLAPAALSAQDKPTLTLQQAIERSQRAQPLVIQAGGQVRTADARVRAAKGAYLPNLTVTGSAGETYSGTQRTDLSTGQIIQGGTTNPSVNGSVSSSIELFDGFRRRAESKAANANRESAAAGYDDARFQQALTTTNQFYDVLAAAELVGVRQSSVRRAEEQLKVSIARLRAGAAIRPDSLRSLVTLGTAKLQLIAVQTQLATAEANLGRLVGVDGAVGAAEDSALYRLMPALDTMALRKEAVGRSPQVIAADAAARSARVALGVNRAAYWPSISLGGSATTNGNRQHLPTDSSFAFTPQRQLQLSLNWQVFSRFTREQGIVNQTIAAETAEATAADTRRRVESSLTAQFSQLDAAQTRIDITQTSVVAATEDLRVQQERYRLGVATIVDVLTSQEALSQAEVDVVNARFDYLRAKAQIEALIGRSL